MTPLIYSTALVDLTPDFAKCDLRPDMTLALHAVESGRVPVLAAAPGRWLWRRRRMATIGHLDDAHSEFIRPYLSLADTLRVRVVSVSGPAMNPKGVAISVWGKVPYRPSGRGHA